MDDLANFAGLNHAFMPIVVEAVSLENIFAT